MVSAGAVRALVRVRLDQGAGSLAAGHPNEPDPRRAQTNPPRYSRLCDPLRDPALWIVIVGGGSAGMRFDNLAS
jgi:hypothetical protein